MNLESLIRPHLLALKPYSSARDEYTGKEGIFLDANENSFGSATHQLYNRYPDPYQHEVKALIAKLKGIDPSCIFLGNGSDEPIDLLIRLFCEPGTDSILITPPTYGMYAVSAGIHRVGIKEVVLEPDFSLSAPNVLNAADPLTKIIFLCSPNNPTGNLLSKESIRQVLHNFHGIVVVDEAYIDFAETQSWIHALSEFPNLVVLQTFSKAWGMAALRLGMAFGSRALIGFLNKIKPPYNINAVTQQLAIEALGNHTAMNTFVKQIIEERKHLEEQLISLPFVLKIVPSEANFLLVKVKEPKLLYRYLANGHIIVRDRSLVQLCEGCLRITVGTPADNKALLKALREFTES